MLARPATAQGAPAAPHAFRLGVAAGTGYESNPRFLAPGDAGSSVRRLRATAEAAARRGRTRGALRARGEVVRYPAARDLDRATYEIEGEALRTFTPRLSGGARAVARTSVTSDAGVVGAGPTANALPLVPVALTRTQAATAATAYRLTPQLTFNAEVGASRVRYTAIGVPLSGDASATPPILPGGATVTARLRAERHIAQTAAAGGAYEVSRLSTAGLPGQTLHTLAFDARTQGRSLLLGARVGAALLATAGSAAAVVRPAAELSAAVPLGRALGATGQVEAPGSSAGGAVLALRAAHTPAPALGLGRVLVTDQVGADLTRGVARRLALRLGAEAAWSDDPLAPTLHLRATMLAAEARYALPALRGAARSGGSPSAGAWVAVGLFARDRRQFGALSAVPTGAVATRGVTLTLGYGLP